MRFQISSKCSKYPLLSKACFAFSFCSLSRFSRFVALLSTMKRRQLEEEEEDEGSSSSSKRPAGKAPAAKSAGSDVVARRTEERHERFVTLIAALNRSFAAHVKEAIERDPLASLIDAGNEYVQYVQALEERYTRAGGDVYSCGSGECGQLGHGVEDESVLAVCANCEEATAQCDSILWLGSATAPVGVPAGAAGAHGDLRRDSLRGGYGRRSCVVLGL